MARGKMREQIKQIENQRKIDRMGNLLEMDGKCRILGRKSALIDIDGVSNDDVSPEKKMRTIFNEKEDENVNDSSAVVPAMAPSKSELPNHKPLKLTKPNSKIDRTEKIIGFENETSQNNPTERPKLTNLDKLFDEPTHDSSEDEFVSDDEPATSSNNAIAEVIDRPTGSVEGLKKILYAKLHDKIVSGKISNDPVEKITISDEEEDQFMSSSEEDESEESKPIKSVTQVECEPLPKRNITDRAITLSSSDEDEEIDDNKNVKQNNLNESEDANIREPASKDIIPVSTTSKPISKGPKIQAKKDSKLENLVKQKEAALLARILKSRTGGSDETPQIDESNTVIRNNIEEKPEVEPDMTGESGSKSEAKKDTEPKVEVTSDNEPETKPETTGKSEAKPPPQSGAHTENEDKQKVESEESDNKSETSNLPETEPEVEPVFDFKLEALRRENELSRIRLENASKITQAPSSDLYLDAAQLLNLFGAGIMFAPGEAEAQCARLEYDSITEGTITDDSDTFLFGGRRVYRHMTPGKMTPILHSMDDLGYNRNQLIGIAHLTGSDYCTGVNGIGPKVKVELEQGLL